MKRKKKKETKKSAKNKSDKLIECILQILADLIVGVLLILIEKSVG